MSNSTSLVSQNQNPITGYTSGPNLNPVANLAGPKNATQDYFIKRIALKIFGYIKTVFQAIVTLGFAPVYLFNRTRHIIGYRSTASTAIPQQTTPSIQAPQKTSTPIDEPAQKISLQQAVPSTTEDSPALTNDIAEKVGTLPTIIFQQVMAPSTSEASTPMNEVAQEADTPQQQPLSTLPLNPAQAETTIKNTEPSPDPLKGRVVKLLTAASAIPWVLLCFSCDAISKRVLSLFQWTAPGSANPVDTIEDKSKYEEHNQNTEMPSLSELISSISGSDFDPKIKGTIIKELTEIQTRFLAREKEYDARVVAAFNPRNDTRPQTQPLVGNALLLCVIAWAIYKFGCSKSKGPVEDKTDYHYSDTVWDSDVDMSSNSDKYEEKGSDTD